jgi:hypothetical protein
MLRTFALAAAAFALVACASTPTYAPATSQGSVGYSERQIESNRYFVTYRSGVSAETTLLQDYALLRAADLTLESGRDWFWVDRVSFEDLNERSNGPSIGIGIGGGSWGRSSGGGVGVGMNFPLGGQSVRGNARGATVEIRFGEGVKPDDPNAYDARSTSQTIRGRLPPG